MSALQLHIYPHPHFYDQDEIHVPGYIVSRDGLHSDSVISDLGLDLSTPDFLFGEEPAAEELSALDDLEIPQLPSEPCDGYVQPQPVASTSHDLTTIYEEENSTSIEQSPILESEPFILNALLGAPVPVVSVPVASTSYHVPVGQFDDETS